MFFHWPPQIAVTIKSKLGNTRNEEQFKTELGEEHCVLIIVILAILLQTFPTCFIIYN